MRVLIVGGGIAGLTLAAKLRQQGRKPVVVEKAPQYTDIGYAIGLYPLGSCVLHGLGAYEALLARSLVARRYEIADHTGEVLQGLDMSAFAGEIGPMVMVPRSDLVDVLCQACGDLPIRMGTTVHQLEQHGDTVRATLSDQSTDEFDLVVLCDGIHSATRNQVFGECDVFDTGWTIWTWWGGEDLFPHELVREYWGRGWIFGGYPVPGKRMFIAGLPNDAIPERHAPTEVVRPILEEKLSELTSRDAAVRGALADATQLFPWPMTDVRMQHWSKGRITLCGDSGMAFLPTAGVGASNAMRSAAVLADELSRADAQLVPLALELYEKRCYRLVRGNQDDSRKVGRFMFVESQAIGWSRDLLLKHMSATSFLKNIVESMRTPF